MSKLLMSSIVATLIVGASEAPKADSAAPSAPAKAGVEKKSFDIERFIKRSLIRNPRVKVNSVEVIEKRKLPNTPEWEAYMVLMDLSFGKKNSIKIPEIIFVDSKNSLATSKLIDIKSGMDLSRNIKPDLGSEYYNDEHLIAGDKNAKHKMVVFSDPQCPFCKSFVPSMLDEVRKHPEKVAVYYYHMPLLRLHPVSDTLTRVMQKLQKEGRVSDAMKMYDLDINPRLKDEKKILAKIKKQFGIELKKEDIDSKEIKDAVKRDREMGNRMMVSGTPTVYFDGKYDAGRSEYKKYLK